VKPAHPRFRSRHRAEAALLHRILHRIATELRKHPDTSHHLAVTNAADARALAALLNLLATQPTQSTIRRRAVELCRIALTRPDSHPAAVRRDPSPRRSTKMPMKACTVPWVVILRPPAAGRGFCR
jgi:hypothetical protein